jgi:hypothetical protein
MPRLQPTVRQLQPLARRNDASPIADEQAEPHARTASTRPPEPSVGVGPRRRRRRRPAARARPSAQ